VKKTILVIAALAAMGSSAFAQSSVTIYGIVDVAVRHTSNEQNAGQPEAGMWREIGGGMSQSRLGINTVEDLGGGMKALVNLEHRLLPDNGTQPGAQFWQQSWVGLQTGFGRVTLGRQYNVLFDVVTSTYASYPYSPYFEAYKPEIGFAVGARADNMVKYLIEVGPVRAALQVSAGEGSATGGKTVGGYLRYSDSGIGAGVGYEEYEFASEKKLKATTFGASYKTGPWYFNVGWGENKVDSGLTAIDRATLGAFWTGSANGGFGGAAFLAADKRQIWSVGTNFQATTELNLGIHYFHAKQSGPLASADATAKFLTAAADYALSKRTDAYLEADTTKLTGNVSLNGAGGAANGAQKRNGFTIGLRHRF
jgi:predicted porin